MVASQKSQGTREIRKQIKPMFSNLKTHILNDHASSTEIIKFLILKNPLIQVMIKYVTKYIYINHDYISQIFKIKDSHESQTSSHSLPRL